LIRADVLIFGAGPAGAVAALNLAPTWRVILVERKAQAVRRIGEALPPAARRLLTDMGLFDASWRKATCRATATAQSGGTQIRWKPILHAIPTALAGISIARDSTDGYVAQP